MAQRKVKEFIYDGCTAAAHIAYAASDTAFIYPITPSSAMAEAASLWEHQERKNVFGQILTIRQMQSEAGAAGAVHGSLVVGTLTTTFTASQGLLLMIPNMYKIAGELLPCVFHVSARAIAGQALSIFGDHSDVMAVRQAGFALLSSASVQEAVDMALASHMSTLKASVPFVHFFDGFRTSHELQKVEVPSNEEIHDLLDHEAIQQFRERALCPTRPKLIGTSQGPEVYFQNQEAANRYYAKVPAIVEECFEKLAKLTGRQYKLFDYYGPEDAEDVIILMGAGYPVVCELSDYLKSKGDKLGVVNVHLYRPWCVSRFVECLPKSLKRVAVLDKTREAVSVGEPLFMDVAASFQKCGINAHITGGRYGLGSKDFTPAMVMAVVQNMRSEKPIPRFVVGIEDDVTNLSLNYKVHLGINTVPAGTVQCMFWGMGSDGTVGANKNVIKIIGDNTPMQVQGYFAYSAHKAGGLTVSHLRFGKQPITSQYLLQVNQAEYVACHRDAYVKQFNIIDYVKEKGIFVLNCMWSDSELDKELPATIRREIARKDIAFYTVNASKVAQEAGMGRRVNNVLMTIFFQLSGVLPIDEAIALFKTAIQKSYGKKGQHVVEANWKSVDMAVSACHKVQYNKEAWLNAESERRIDKRKLDNAPEFVTNVLLQLEKLEGDDLPVSKFEAGGVLPLGTAAYEKRGIALKVPIVDMDKCTQCNYCSFVCPHAAIRPFLLDEDEVEKAPETFDMRRAKGANEIAPYKYRIQVSPMDCTGCELCSIACPDNCLTMTPLETVQAVETVNWDFAIDLNSKEDLCVSTRNTIKGSQFYTPLVEFSGACEGCGETPYVKLLTQLFGERLLIANATGCSSIWGASYPSVPYTKNQKGYGPAWGNSLFEDAAEYGFGMIIAMHHRREQLAAIVKKVLDDEAIVGQCSYELINNLRQWHDIHEANPAECQRIFEVLKPLLTAEKTKHSLLQSIDDDKDLLPRISHWIIGGDGWAYDIGYGGLDHVIASGANVNILVLDTEVYSNTGGQISKSTPTGAVHKFSFGGNLRNKKDLGMILMEYGNVYVASVASSANMTQTVRAFVEAEAYPGPSLILAYSPCIEHGYIKPFSGQIEHCRLSVESGYWPLYRYNPVMDPPLQLDLKKIRGSVKDLVKKENRFAQLRKTNPAAADMVEEELEKWVKRRWAILKAKSERCVELDNIQVPTPEEDAVEPRADAIAVDAVAV